MPNQKHIDIAKMATVHVDDRLPLGPSNFNNPQQGAVKAVETVQAAVSKFAHLGPAARIRKHGELAIGHQAGNCGAMASLAFEFIRIAAPSIRPISFVSFMGHFGADRHACVAMGVPKQDGEDRYWHDEWPSDTVICDPWLAHIVINNRERGLIRHLDSDTIMGAFTKGVHADWVDEVGYHAKKYVTEYCRLED